MQQHILVSKNRAQYRLARLRDGRPYRRRARRDGRRARGRSCGNLLLYGHLRLYRHGRPNRRDLGCTRDVQESPPAQ